MIDFVVQSNLMVYSLTMSGCTECSNKTGCTDRKGPMLDQVYQSLERIYPSRIWGEPNDEARFGSGICMHEGQDLAQEIETTLKASTVYCSGSDEDYCDYIYILCMGRDPSLMKIQEKQLSMPDDLETPLHEMYLRICLSNMARLVGVQQVSVFLEQEDSRYFIREVPRAGVYDAPLLPRFQQLVGVFQNYDMMHVDFGEISEPPDGFDHSHYESLYANKPDVANYLFYPQPSTMESISELRR